MRQTRIFLREKNEADVGDVLAAVDVDVSQLSKRERRWKRRIRQRNFSDVQKRQIQIVDFRRWKRNVRHHLARKTNIFNALISDLICRICMSYINRTLDYFNILSGSTKISKDQGIKQIWCGFR